MEQEKLRNKKNTNLKESTQHDCRPRRVKNSLHAIDSLAGLIDRASNWNAERPGGARNPDGFFYSSNFLSRSLPNWAASTYAVLFHFPMSCPSLSLSLCHAHALLICTQFSPVNNVLRNRLVLVLLILENFLMPIDWMFDQTPFR